MQSASPSSNQIAHGLEANGEAVNTHPSTRTGMTWRQDWMDICDTCFNLRAFPQVLAAWHSCPANSEAPTPLASLGRAKSMWWNLSIRLPSGPWNYKNIARYSYIKTTFSLFKNRTQGRFLIGRLFLCTLFLYRGSIVEETLQRET